MEHHSVDWYKDTWKISFPNYQTVHIYFATFHNALLLKQIAKSANNIITLNESYLTIFFCTFTMLFYMMLYCTILHYTVLYYTVLYCTIPYHTIPYHTIPYHTIPYHTIPYHTIPYHTIPCLLNFTLS